MENKDLERAVYMWFNMKYELYNRLDHDDSIYLYDEGEEYADIVIDRKYEEIYYNSEISEEFFDVFPLEFDEFEKFMTKWVGDTFNLKEFTPVIDEGPGAFLLEIPLI